MFKMIDSADHISKKTGLTCTVNLSKAGGAFGAAGGTITEVANGWYKIALTTTDTNTLGDLAYYITATGADDTDFSDQVSVRLIDDAAFPATSGRSMVVDANGLVDANTVKVGPTGSGTAQTARDVGASVLLSSGSGTGQLDFTAGVVKANLAQILGTPLTETAGQIAAAFKKFFDIGSPTSTMNVITTVSTASALTANNDKTGYTVSTVSDKTGYSIAVGGIGSGAIASAEKNNIADANLDRNLATGTDSGGRTVRNALRPSLNKTAIAAGTLTVYKEDDSTSAWTGSVATTPGDPISSVDPA